MYPLLFELGPLSIYSYGLLLATAYIVGLRFALRRADRAGPPGVGPGLVPADLVILKPIAVLLLHRLERVAQRHDRAFD